MNNAANLDPVFYALQLVKASHKAGLPAVDPDPRDTAYLRSLSDAELERVCYLREEGFERRGDGLSQDSADRAWAERERRAEGRA
jgi:hypothetical protein